MNFELTLKRIRTYIRISCCNIVMPIKMKINDTICKGYEEA